MLFNLIRGSGFTWTTFVLYVIADLIVIFLTLPVHEFAHAFAADKLGDSTARYQGRLTLNPMAHIDPIGAVAILFFGFGWAKPVPVTGLRFKKPKRDMAIVALAGPLANLIIALLSMLIFNLLMYFGADFSQFESGYGMLYFVKDYTVLHYIAQIFNAIAVINISLAVFNLIPIPPLDGSRLLTAFLPSRIYYKLMQYEQYFFIVLLAVLWVGLLTGPLDFLRNAVSDGIYWLTSLPFSLL